MSVITRMDFWRFSPYYGSGEALTASSDPVLVGLSIVVACLAAAVAFAAALRMRSSTDPQRARAWWFIGALSMGGGVWAMHFTAMLSYTLPLPMSYDPALTIVSVIPAVLGAGMGLRVLAKTRNDWRAAQVGGVCLALGIGTMHYVGMEAVRTGAIMRYEPALFLLSIGVAHVLGTAALSPRLIGIGEGRRRLVDTVLPAVFMGLAVAGMHYTAMAAVRFYAIGSWVSSETSVPPRFVWVGIVLFIMFLLVAALAFAYLEQELSSAQKQVDERAARLHTVLHTMPDGLITLDEKHRIQTVNRGAERILRVKEAAVLGRSITEFLPNGLQAAYPSTVSLEAGRWSRARRADGADFHAEIRWSEARIGATAIKTVVLRDVSDQKAIEAHMERLAAAVDQASEAISITDPAGRVLYANPAFSVMTGLSRDETLGVMPDSLRVDSEEDRKNSPVWRTLLDGAVWRNEFTSDRNEGESYECHVTITPVHDSSGEITSFVEIRQDISERRTLERQLRQAQKMEAVGQLTGGIAHDFNNVLAAILTNAQLLTMTLPPELVEKGSELHDIECAARRGADLIKELMAFSRDDRLELEAVNPSEILKETVDLLKRVLPESIELTLEEAHAGAFIKVDRSGIQQILLNLATNARDAMPEGGTLAISTRVSGAGTRRSEMDGDPRVEITTRDTGVGMNAETLERAFEPFFTTKDRGKGTGLGLAMVYGLVQRHGGTIEVASEPGLGTTCTVSLPIAEPEEQRPRKREALRNEPSAHSGKTLLLVEDEDPLRRAGQRVLEHFGYRVLLAENGRQALEVLEAHRAEISLVVTDFIMPQAGGAALYEATSDWELRPAFLITSGYSPRELGVLNGDLPFLRKPWDALDLVEAVGEALNGSQDTNLG